MNKLRFSCSLGIGFVFLIFLLLFLFLKFSPAFAAEQYFSGSLPVGWAPCAPASCPAIPSFGFTCQNGASVGSNTCSTSACTGGDVWSKYSAYSTSTCYTSGAFCFWAFQFGFASCSTGDKCGDATGGNVGPYLNAGSCDCTVGNQFKTCCNGSNTGGACVQTQDDTTNPPYEGYCPDTTTEVVCPKDSTVASYYPNGFCYEVFGCPFGQNYCYLGKTGVGNQDRWCTNSACGTNACQAIFPLPTPTPTPTPAPSTGTIQGYRVVMPNYQTINPDPNKSAMSVDHAVCPSDSSGNIDCSVPEPNPYYFFNVTSGSHYVNVNGVPQGWSVWHADCPAGGPSCTGSTQATLDRVYTGDAGDNFNVPSGSAINPWWLVYPAPTASITGPSYATTNQTVSFTGTASDANSSLSQGEIYWSKTSSEKWTRLDPVAALTGSTGSFSRNWTPTAAGTYYVVTNAYNSYGGKCTGNPFSIAAVWADCGTKGASATDTDVVTVTVNAPTLTLTLTPTPTPAPTYTISG